jgi:DNA-binding MarR family transcriptional regulator
MRTDGREVCVSGAQLDSPAESPGYLLWRATLDWQRRVNEALLDFGLTHTRFALLATLWWFASGDDGPPTQREAGEAAGLDPMLTSQVARALEKHGLITRTPDERDARALRLWITPRGRRHAARAVKAVEGAEAAFFASLAGGAALADALGALARARRDA